MNEMSHAPAGGGFAIGDALAEPDLADIRKLLREYEALVAVELSHQGFESELSRLPGEYAPPGGCLLLARCEGVAAGCVGVRPLEPGVCELKRLFTRAAFRGRGLGRTLMDAALERARALGYTHMRLDTLPRLDAAIALYRALGFREIDPYGPEYGDGALYFELSL